MEPCFTLTHQASQADWTNHFWGIHPTTQLSWSHNGAPCRRLVSCAKKSFQISHTNGCDYSVTGWVSISPKLVRKPAFLHLSPVCVCVSANLMTTWELCFESHILCTQKLIRWNEKIQFWPWFGLCSTPQTFVRAKLWRNWQLICSSAQQPLPSNVSLLCSIFKHHSKIRQLTPTTDKTLHSSRCVCACCPRKLPCSSLFSVYFCTKHAHIII